MKTIVCAIPLLAASLPAQFPLLTSIPAGNAVSASVPAAAGPSGNVWIAGIDHVMRLDGEGRPVFTTRLENVGGISALAVDGSSNAVIATTDFRTSYLIVVDAQGRVSRSQRIAGIPAAVAADNQGNVFVAGRAPDGFNGTPGAHKPSFGEKRCTNRNQDLFACDDAFLMKLRVDGTLLWTTLFGGSMNDSAKAIALDPSGSIWIAGETMSSNLPVTPGALQGAYGGGETLGPLEFGDGFLARMDPSGARLEYATYLGGSRFDQATTLTATATGVLVAGGTESLNFPTTPNGFQRSLTNSTPGMPGLNNDAFVAFVSTAGTLVYSSYYGEDRQQTASASALGPPNEIAVSLAGFSRRCLVRLEVRETVTRFTPDCYRTAFETPFTPVYANGNWLAVGQTKRGLAVPGVNPAAYLTAQHYGDDNPGPGIAGAWNEYVPDFRPVVAPDSFITIYMPISANLSNVFVRLGNRDLTVLYASNNQINALVPPGLPTGTHPLTVNFPFFGTIPIPVDVVERWPGLASAALNQDGTVNSAANPSDRGTIVSLFGSGFGPAPFPVLEPYILSSGVTSAQGMELFFAGRVADGLFQVNARIPPNAVPGHTPVRIVFRTADGFLLSGLAKIHVR
ncbi:MAG: hypothetical protein ACKV2U_23920 [Bryobacteraceae bacterium]